MKTTLNKIKAHEPCTYGWKKLLKHLGKTKADDEPLSIVQILDSNGIDDALWCLRAVDGYEKEMRLYAVWCARQVLHLMQDERSIKAIDAAEHFANGEARDEDLVYSWAGVAWEVARSARQAAAPYGPWDFVKNPKWDAAKAATQDAQAKRLRELCSDIEAMKARK